MKKELSKKTIKIGMRIRRIRNRKKKVYTVIGPDNSCWGWRLRNDCESMTIYDNELNEWEVV